ncbi:diacylglycerol kinase [Hellea balneolensis]|uniref:diacylglycerol kinase n=1 Tax=Hellea balneolensis TaxID=287478 RepID=UPI00040B0BAC|nr:diacylglycerol kinase [Hellea balneolensis]
MLTALIQQAKNATKYSLEGFQYLFKSEFAARIEVYCFIWFFPALVFLKLSPIYLLSSLLLFLMLLATEALNTAVEVIVDKVSPEISAMGKQAKDLGSFAVMCALIMNFAHLAFVLTKVNWTAVDVNLAIIFSLIALLIGVYLAVWPHSRKRILFLVTPVLLLYFLALGIYLASNAFTGAGFDNKVIYHLKTGLSGAGFAEYTGLILWMTLYSVIGLALVYLVHDLIGKKKRGISQKLSGYMTRQVKFEATRGETDSTHRVPDQKIKHWLSLGALLLAVILNPLTANLATLLNRPSPKLVTMSDYELYVQRDVASLASEVKIKKNFLFVYLEGLERTYFDPELFPGLTPNLAALEANHISFSDIRQVYNTEWTIAGMVATQCGVPMYTPSQGNTMNAYDQFMPNAVCLGDILDRNDYQLEFLGGGDLDFAGKGKFLKSHGFDKAIGRDDHEKGNFSEAEYNGWGLYDDTLLGVAYDKFVSLSQNDDPFGLFVLTLDTHQPKGHVSPSCEGRVYQDGSNPLLNSVFCTDQLFSDFVKKIQATPYVDETLIVIVSDHIAMNGTTSDLLAKGQRRNLFMIIDPSATKPLRVERLASPLDVAPTVLSYLGVESSSIGFGRNLFADKKTLIEEKPEHFNFFLWQVGKKIKSELWNFPELSQGLVLDIKTERLNIGRRWISVPAILVLNKDNEISTLEFYSVDAGERKGYLVNKLPKEMPYLWVDNCAEMEAKQPNNAVLVYTEGEWCAGLGENNNLLNEISKVKHRGKVFPEIFKP